MNYSQFQLATLKHTYGYCYYYCCFYYFVLIIMLLLGNFFYQYILFSF